MADDTLSEADWTLVQRYLLGTVTPAEADSARELVERDRQIRTLVDVLQTTRLAADDPVMDPSALKRRIDASRIGASSPRQRKTEKGIFKPQPLPRTVWLAAVLPVLIVAAVIFGRHLGLDAVNHPASMSVMAYITAKGQRATITLPDGGTVALNVDSRLEVPLDYMSGRHTIRLVGEGLFTIPHHDGEPFTVLAGGVATRVLGTTFLVRRYATDSLTTVAVRTGRVAVRTAIVAAAQQVVAGPTGVGPVQSVNPAQFGFATGILSLDGVPLSVAIPELDRWYDVDIRLTDPALASRRVAAEFGVESVGDLIDILSGALPVRVVRHGRVLTLSPR